jgi:hypothetical protein
VHNHESPIFQEIDAVIEESLASLNHLGTRERSQPSESLAIISGGDFHNALKRTPHRVSTPKTAFFRNFFDGVRAYFQPLTRGLYSNFLDKSGWRFPNFIAKHAGEVSFTHMRALCECLNGEVTTEIVGSPGDELIDDVALCLLRFQSRAKLRLSARTSHEHDQVSCTLNRDRLAQVFFNKRQGEVDTGGYTGRRINVVIFDKYGVCLNVDVWKTRG